MKEQPKKRSLVTLCSKCAKFKHIALLKVCKKCRKTSDSDRDTLLYCTTCATALGVCRACGKKLKPRAKIVNLNLDLNPPKTVEELKQIVIRLAKTPGVIIIEQVFPNMILPGLAALCIVKADVSKVAAVMTILGNNPDVKSVQIAPLRKVQKRRKR